MLTDFLFCSLLGLSVQGVLSQTEDPLPLSSDSVSSGSSL